MSSSPYIVPAEGTKKADTSTSSSTIAGWAKKATPTATVSSPSPQNPSSDPQNPSSTDPKHSTGKDITPFASPDADAKTPVPKMNLFLTNKVARFGHKLRSQAEETKKGNRGIMELAKRHQMKSKKEKAREQKIEAIDNTRKPYIIDPDHASKQAWDVVVLLLVVINLFTIPIAMAQQFEQEESPFFSTLVDMLFIIDLIVTFLTGYNLTNGERIWNHRMIVENYVYSGWFFIDFVACVPWELFANAVNGGTPQEGNDALRYTLLVRALKLPRLLRLGKVFKYLNRFKYAQAWKIIRLLMIMIISAHWVGCLFFFTCELQMSAQMSGEEPWCEQEEVKSQSGSGRLLIAFHTAFLMLVGEGIGPTTMVEYAYTTVALIVGQIISAVVIGNISIVLNNQASMSALYTQKMDRVNESMMTLKLPTLLQTKGTVYVWFPLPPPPFLILCEFCFLTSFLFFFFNLFFFSPKNSTYVL